MKKYKIIYADPPWSYNDKSLNRGGAERYYRTSHHSEIGGIDVQSVADEDCILFMWATFPKIAEALELMNLWGFQYKTNAFTWIKTNKKSGTPFWGMGRWTRSNAEILLLGVKGKPKRLDAGVHSVVHSPVRKHSEKPPEVRDLILRLVGDLPRLEMFARSSSEGWDVFGDEASGSIEIPFKRGVGAELRV